MEPKWQPSYTIHPLAKTVLVVAVTRIEGSWCAFCDSVLGIYHNTEKYAVVKHGDKLPEHIARAMFPGFEDIPYAS